MKIVNPSKALIALVGLICITVLMAVSKIDTAAGTGLIGSILGYCTGNGMAAKSHQSVEPIIGKKANDG
jgi:hypothetical protein